MAAYNEGVFEMTYQIVESSPLAKARIKSYESTATVEQNTHHRTKYPIDELNIGQSFTVPLAEANETSLRITATNRGKKAGKKFCVIKHADYQCFEVARIA
ncbi:hypothetical protein PM396_gp35 [Xanthomonas phage vB_Xar_IVIA-DoCa1]|nr:hypothetical protein PM396_gp35 [Xanthomonas phage vB_Xar_IVIA-DoCa1]UVB02958.1 hypothetical protein IVIADoCa1_35 [Xanthomonas phage vB_Xar_IVIA-DoCa1]